MTKWLEVGFAIKDVKNPLDLHAPIMKALPKGATVSRFYIGKVGTQRRSSNRTVRTDDGDVVRIVRQIVTWSNDVKWLAVGKAGQCYRKRDGRRTYLFCFTNARELTINGKPFTFDSVSEAEKWLDGLNELRKKNP